MVLGAGMWTVDKLLLCASRLSRVPHERCARCAEARLTSNSGTMERCPKGVTGALASQMGVQLQCLSGNNSVGV